MNSCFSSNKSGLATVVLCLTKRFIFSQLPSFLPYLFPFLQVNLDEPDALRLRRRPMLPAKWMFMEMLTIRNKKQDNYGHLLPQGQ